MKKRYTILYIFISISTLIGAYDPVTHEITESFMIFKLTPKWILILSLIISLILGIFYSVSLLTHKTVRYLSNGAKLIRLLFWIPILSFGMIAMMYGLLSGATLMINRIIGEQKIITISGQVVDSRKNITKHGTSYYVTIMTDNLDTNRKIDFRVPKNVTIGQTYNEKVMIGSLGLLYKK